MSVRSWELQPQVDHHKSFYGKARCYSNGNEIRLISYSTHVASVIYDDETGEKRLEVYGFYSSTTLRHIKEFAYQNGFGSMTKKGLEEYLVED